MISLAISSFKAGVSTPAVVFANGLTNPDDGLRICGGSFDVLELPSEIASRRNGRLQFWGSEKIPGAFVDRDTHRDFSAGISGERGGDGFGSPVTLGGEQVNDAGGPRGNRVGNKSAFFFIARESGLELFGDFLDVIRAYDRDRAEELGRAFVDGEEDVVATGE